MKTIDLPLKTLDDIVRLTNTARGIDELPRISTDELMQMTGLDKAGLKQLPALETIRIGEAELAALRLVFDGVPAKLQYFCADDFYMSAREIRAQILKGAFEPQDLYEDIVRNRPSRTATPPPRMA